MVAVIPILKPVVYLWFGLKALDDVSLLMRVARLAAVLVPGNDEDGMCDLCDDVMGDLLAQDGISVLPCRLLCLRIPKCVQMCESVKDMSSTSTKYPCVAAGYCDATEENIAQADVQCSVGRFFSCTPRKYCHRVRTNLFQFSCVLKPGLGRWVGLQNSLAENAGALAAGLVRQVHCGEPDAGPYCIAKPTGLGAVCEVIGAALSIIYGGYQSILAIESPGGDDDTQWLTFWLVQGAVLSVERFFMRPILSNVSMYYEVKLCILIWLMWFNGSERAYRRFRRFLIARNLMEPAQTDVGEELAVLEETGKALIQKRLKEIKREIVVQRRGSGQSMRWSSKHFSSSIIALPDWEPDYEEEEKEEDDHHQLLRNGEAPVVLRPSEKMKRLSDYLLSPAGASELMQSQDISPSEREQLLSLATSHLKFEPKYLYVRVLGTVDEPEGELPPMDDNGLADPYVTCRVVLNPNATSKMSSKTGSKTTPGKRAASVDTKKKELDTVDESKSTDKTKSRRRSLLAKSRELLSRSSFIVAESAKTLTNNVIHPLHHHLSSEKMVTSRTLYRTRRPQWNQMLELPLTAGYIDESGTYHNDTVELSSLCIEVWDADIEFWGYVLRFSPVVLTCLTAAAVVGYVTAVSDHLSSQQIFVVKGIFSSVLAFLALAYVMVVVRKADDDPIGQCTIPLKILMDKGEHSLRLTIREMEKHNKDKSLASIIRNASHNSLTSLSKKGGSETEDDSSDSTGEPTPTNDYGGYGILRVKLMLSEN